VLLKTFCDQQPFRYSAGGGMVGSDSFTYTSE
jgi:hypothetical protein